MAESSAFLGRIGPMTAALSWVITIAVLGSVRWIVLIPSLHARTSMVVPSAPSADVAIVAGSASAFGVMFAVCGIDPGHAFTLGGITLFLAAFVTIGVSVLALQRRMRVIELIAPFVIVVFSGAMTLFFVHTGRMYFGESLVAPLVATLALLGWGGVYRRAWRQLREEVRAELRHEPRRAHGAGNVIHLRRDGSDDPPSAA